MNDSFFHRLHSQLTLSGLHQQQTLLSIFVFIVSHVAMAIFNVPLSRYTGSCSTRQDADLAYGFFITEKLVVQSKNTDCVIYFPPDVFEPAFHCKDVKESEEHGGSQL